MDEIAAAIIAAYNQVNFEGMAVHWLDYVDLNKLTSDEVTPHDIGMEE